MPTSIVHLPTELIVEIIRSDNSTDATTIACLGMTCRRLHGICQVFVLERQLPVLRALASKGFLRIYKNSGSVAMKEEDLHDVKEIFQASFHKIEYISVTSTIEAIASVHGLILHASAVGHIVLHFNHLPSIRVMMSSYPYKAYRHKDGYNPLAPLVGVSCEKMGVASMTITGSPESAFEYTPIPRPKTQKNELSIFGRLKNHFFGGIGTSRPNRQAAGAPKIPNTGGSTPRELKSFEIQSPLPFHRECFLQTLRALNGGYLTKLSLGCTKLHFSDWSNLLPLLSMPLLSEFNVLKSWIHFRDLSAFLLRHSSITHLGIFCTIPIGPIIMPPKGLLPSLEVISGDPDYLSELLSTRQGHKLFPHLHSVALTPYSIRADMQYGVFSCIFHNLADRKRGTIRLSLEFSHTTNLAVWFYMATGQPYYSIRLDCVKSLEIIRSGSKSPITSAICDSFFSWVLVKFPCVQEVDLTRVIPQDPGMWTRRFDVLGDLCPELQSIIVGEKTYQRPAKAVQ